MLAGYSRSSLLSPTRRLRSEAVAATISVHFPMNTQRLDLPYSSSFSRKETPSLGRSISLDNNNNKPIERKTRGCSLKQSIKLPPLATTRVNTQGFSWNNDSNNRGKKRLAEENKDESCLSRVKKRQRSLPVGRDWRKRTRTNLPVEFHPVVVDRLEDVRLWMLHVKEGEAVAVNCVSQMHKTLHDGTGAAFRSFVGLVGSTNPVAVVVAEQEGEHDSVRLEGRVFNSLRYYSAVFDVMHKHLGSDSLVRVKIEEMLFGREIRNIVACEGSHRRERHVGSGQWRRMMEQLGFRNLGVREREVLQGKMLLRMYGDGDEGFFNVERSGEDGGGGGGVTLRWLEQPLYTVSAWGIGGSSSF